MNISEIITNELINANGIVLYKEGIFWKMFEKSAFRFVSHFKPYQIIKKPLKESGQQYVYCGFPDNALEQNLKLMDNQNVTRNNTRIEINGFETLNEEAFHAWKNNFDIIVKTNPTNAKNSSNNFSGNYDGIIERIKLFQLINKTPVDCQLFIMELQKELNGTV